MLLDERIEEQEKAGGGLGPRVVLQVGAGALNARASCSRKRAAGRAADVGAGRFARQGVSAMEAL